MGVWVLAGLYDAEEDPESWQGCMGRGEEDPGSWQGCIGGGLGPGRGVRGPHLCMACILSPSSMLLLSACWLWRRLSLASTRSWCASYSSRLG